jgi:DNA-binding MarR family transcriptional regulator
VLCQDQDVVDGGPDLRLMLELARALVGVAMRSVEEAASDVSLPQYRALLVLERVGPCNAGGLAEQLGTHPSTVTRICDRLVALGYLTRETRSDNRREVELDVTDSGRALVHAVEQHRADELTRWLDAMPGDSRGQLAAALPDLVAVATPSRQDGGVPVGWAH